MVKRRALPFGTTLSLSEPLTASLVFALPMAPLIPIHGIPAATLIPVPPLPEITTPGPEKIPVLLTDLKVSSTRLRLSMETRLLKLCVSPYVTSLVACTVADVLLSPKLELGTTASFARAVVEEATASLLFVVLASFSELIPQLSSAALQAVVALSPSL